MTRARAGPHEFPWAAAILRNSSGGHFVPMCGGALIDQRWVLTAAHCAVGTRDRVIVGAATLSDGRGNDVEIEAVHLHPDFDRDSLESDVALVKLARPLTQTPTLAVDDGAKSIALEGTALAIGWGARKLGGAFSMTLGKWSVPLPPPAACADAVPPSQICGGSADGEGGMSTGDSGSPLLLRDRAGRWVGVGIASDRAADGIFDRYMRVAFFAEWIADTLSESAPTEAGRVARCTWK